MASVKALEQLIWAGLLAHVNAADRADEVISGVARSGPGGDDLVWVETGAVVSDADLARLDTAFDRVIGRLSGLAGDRD